MAGDGLARFARGGAWDRACTAAFVSALRGDLADAERILVDSGIFGVAVAHAVVRSAWSASIEVAGEEVPDAR